MFRRCAITATKLASSCVPKTTAAAPVFIRSLSDAAASASSPPPPPTITKLLSLDDLHNLPGQRQTTKRLGRGIGSGKGKTAGRGQKGTFARSGGAISPAFEGGQTPLFRRVPKIGFSNKHNKLDFDTVNVGKLQDYIDMGRLTPRSDALLTMKDLRDAGILSNIRTGIKLLGDGVEKLRSPIHLEVSRASKGAISAIEAVGGTVTCTHFNALALRALMKPTKFDVLPMRARPNPQIMAHYLQDDARGYLSPTVQERNLKMFGHVTSEEPLRQAHEEQRRAALQAERA